MSTTTRVPVRRQQDDRQRRSRRLPWLLATAATLLLFAVTSTAAAQQPLRVVATTGMLADIAQQVGGDCLEVTALMGPGVDPHLYRATASDVRAMQRADLILFSGYSLEGQLGDVLDRLGAQKPVVAVGPAAVPLAELISVEDIYGIDPHLWMDVGLWSRTAGVIAAAAAELRPDCAEAMHARAAELELQLQALDAWVRQAIATIPERQRILVTAHDAFNYYGRAYGIEVAGIQGISTEAEAGIADIREVIDLVIERQVPAIFIESTINPRTVEAVVEAAAKRGHEVALGGQLFSDAMGEPGTAGGTYIGMIYENTLAIVNALGGTPPPLPAALEPWAQQWLAAGGEP